MARGAPPAPGRRAARRVPRPGLPRRDRHPDLGAARPAADGVPRRLQRLPPPARSSGTRGRPRTPRRRRRRSRASGSSSSATGATASSARCTSTRRASSASRRTRRGARGGPEAGLAGRRPRRRRAVALGRDRRPARGARGRLPAGSGRAGADGRSPRSPRLVARAPFLAAQRGERIGIVGPNGAGKTTLLRTIAGDLPPLDGMLAFGNAVQLGYLAQLRDAAIPGATVLDALLEAIPVTAGEARAYLARFLFRGDDAFKEVRLLSGGERSRLELALLGILPRTCCSSTSRRTTSTSRPARRSRRSWPDRRRRCWSCRTTGGCSRRSATSCGWSTTGRRSRSTAAIANGGRRWPRAGPCRGGRAGGERGCVAAAGRGPPPRPYGAAPRDAVRAPARRRGRIDRTTAQHEVPEEGEAVEGRVSAQKAAAEAELTRLGLAQEPPRAGDGRPGGLGELRRDAAGHQRARRHRGRAGRRRGRLARARGAGAVSRRRRLCANAPSVLVAFAVRVMSLVPVIALRS